MFIGEHSSFDEEVIAMSSRYCHLRMYNKDKPEKFRVNCSSRKMQSTILYIIFMYNKVRIQQTLTSTNYYKTYPPHRKLLIILL